MFNVANLPQGAYSHCWQIQIIVIMTKPIIVSDDQERINNGSHAHTDVLKELSHDHNFVTCQSRKCLHSIIITSLFTEL